jgi:RNA polymerase subunit RPABC4/transcription elongation factor Spt4
MAIIKCPECGRQISDKAPTCPNCGVEIAGKIIKCPHCGEIYFSSQEMCPNCHEIASAGPAAPVTPAAPVNPPTPPTPPTPPVPPVRQTPMAAGNGGNGNNGNGRNGNNPENEAQQKAKKMSARSILIISLVFSVLVCGILYYFYDNANRNKEKEAYEYAMQSSDPMVLQSYLDNYKDAEEAHRDSIMAHLEMLKSIDQDWTNALVSGSKQALEDYLQKYPNSPHKQEAWNKIDSIDWNVAKAADNVQAYQAYLDAHADGAHIEEAENAMKKAKSRDLQPEEKQMVSGLFRQFFQSINSHNADGLSATCEDILSSLLGKTSATKADVVTFMDKLYKDNVANMNWHINNDYQIKKREVGEEDYEYQVQFSAVQNLDLTDGSKKQNNFKINAVVSPAGKVSSFNMNQVTTE